LQHLYFMHTCARWACTILFLSSATGWGQTAWLEPATKHELPPVIDGNSAAVWWKGELILFHSDSRPTLSRGPHQFALSPAIKINFVTDQPKTVWIEAAWVDHDDTIFVWYHTEPRVCGEKLASPQIGAGVSYDGGLTVYDLGIILAAGDEPDCEAKNGFFASGHGDFSVVPDEDSGYFYFFFTNYAGPADGQGVAVARMPMEDRFDPIAKVRKYRRGFWGSPGVGGRVTAIFPARATWDRADTNSFWGPSVHYNKHLDMWVMLLNHACCAPEWPQAGVYVSFAFRLDQPSSWQQPQQLMGRGQLYHLPGFYPQILGYGRDGTDTVGGRFSRLYVHGISNWRIHFSWNAAPEGPGDMYPDDDDENNPY
jgi:hypothetical protein